MMRRDFLKLPGAAALTAALPVAASSPAHSGAALASSFYSVPSTLQIDDGAKTLLASGLITVNEARELLGIPRLIDCPYLADPQS